VAVESAAFGTVAASDASQITEDLVANSSAKTTTGGFNLAIGSGGHFIVPFGLCLEAAIVSKRIRLR